MPYKTIPKPTEITPLHWDPKQQELRTHVRPRFGLGPYKDSFSSRTQKMLKKRWFYCVFVPKCWKSNGFTMFSLKHYEKALVLLCFRSKMLKKHWFYSVFAPKCWKSIGFTNKEALKPKNHWFYSVPYVNEEQNAKKWKKTITFYKKKFQPSPKRVMFFKNLQRERSKNHGQRIFGRGSRHSPGYIMRNPYRQAV